jgi:hypothetical protein
MFLPQIRRKVMMEGEVFFADQVIVMAEAEAAHPRREQLVLVLLGMLGMVETVQILQYLEQK